MQNQQNLLTISNPKIVSSLNKRKQESDLLHSSQTHTYAHKLQPLSLSLSLSLSLNFEFSELLVELGNWEISC